MLCPGPRPKVALGASQWWDWRRSSHWYAPGPGELSRDSSGVWCPDAVPIVVTELVPGRLLRAKLPMSTL